jgi:hypothetical protein
MHGRHFGVLWKSGGVAFYDVRLGRFARIVWLKLRRSFVGRFSRGVCVRAPATKSSTLAPEPAAAAASASSAAATEPTSTAAAPASTPAAPAEPAAATEPTCFAPGNQLL